MAAEVRAQNFVERDLYQDIRVPKPEVAAVEQKEDLEIKTPPKALKKYVKIQALMEIKDLKEASLDILQKALRELFELKFKDKPESFNAEAIRHFCLSGHEGNTVLKHLCYRYLQRDNPEEAKKLGISKACMKEDFTQFDCVNRVRDKVLNLLLLNKKDKVKKENVDIPALANIKNLNEASLEVLQNALKKLFELKFRDNPESFNAKAIARFSLSDHEGQKVLKHLSYRYLQRDNPEEAKKLRIDKICRQEGFTLFDCVNRVRVEVLNLSLLSKKEKVEKENVNIPVLANIKDLSEANLEVLQKALKELLELKFKDNPKSFNAKAITRVSLSGYDGNTVLTYLCYRYLQRENHEEAKKLGISKARKQEGFTTFDCVNRVRTEVLNLSLLSKKEKVEKENVDIPVLANIKDLNEASLEVLQNALKKLFELKFKDKPKSFNASIIKRFSLSSHDGEKVLKHLNYRYLQRENPEEAKKLRISKAFKKEGFTGFDCVNRVRIEVLNLSPLNKKEKIEKENLDIPVLVKDKDLKDTDLEILQNVLKKLFELKFIDNPESFNAEAITRVSLSGHEGQKVLKYLSYRYLQSENFEEAKKLGISKACMKEGFTHFDCVNRVRVQVLNLSPLNKKEKGEKENVDIPVLENVKDLSEVNLEDLQKALKELFELKFKDKFKEFNVDVIRHYSLSGHDGQTILIHLSHRYLQIDDPIRAHEVKVSGARKIPDYTTSAVLARFCHEKLGLGNAQPIKSKAEVPEDDFRVGEVLDWL